MLRFTIYLQTQNETHPSRCFHSFPRNDQAIRYAELGARNTMGRTYVMDGNTGKKIRSFDYRPN